MTNSQLFTAAHKLAKTFIGDYKACFKLALHNLRNQITNEPTIENTMTVSEDTREMKRFTFKMRVFTNNPNPKVKNELLWVTESAMAYEEFDAQEVLKGFYKNHSVLRMYCCRTEAA
jgi:hypothetical protein